ncbi:MAG: AMP-binding protein, partial [Gammaproteobacteria bacterium]|nr:AMP-binding protein [Gammaproteobacteria bacterium]
MDAVPTSDGKPQAIEADALLSKVRDVVCELHPHMRDRVQVSLDSTLDRDLGLDSLARVELLVRLEQSFGVTLSEATLASVETPRDVLRALLAGKPGVRTADATVVEAAAVVEVPAPSAAVTLLEALDWHVRAHPDRIHVQLYGDAGEIRDISYRDLLDGARAVAAGLRRLPFTPGQSVAVMLPTGAEYLYSFMGILLAGGVPVPIYPPARLSQIEDHFRRHARILKNAGAVCLITFPPAKRVSRLLTSHVPELRTIVTVPELSGAGLLDEASAASPDTVAFLQYTSGSTGNPKGVVLTHAQLLASLRSMGEALEARSSDVFVSWLPLYHDMGLIGAWFGSLYHAVRLVIMSPLHFLSRPQRWLWAIHRYGGTLSAAPNFAFELCLRRIDDKDIEGLDLQHWRIAANGAEAISPTTMEAFCDRFAAHGFRRATMFPVYGLAECSVGLTFSPIGRGPLVDAIDRDILAREGRAQPATSATPEREALRIVSCGLPLVHHEIRVVDSAGRELPERQEGRLQFRGPSATSGYYRNQEKTAALFQGNWLETGDLAYIAAGELFITGRSKDLIIKAGRNIYPTEIEDLIGELDGIRKGRVAVFGSPDAQTGTERLVVLAETRKKQPQARERLRAAINEIATDVVTMPPDDVVLAAPNTVLKTSSGKIRRAASRKLYEEGRLEQREKAVWLQVARLVMAGVVPQLRRVFRFATTSAFACYA